jgi:transketolase
MTAIDQLTINTIRTLAMDAVQQANSGHPGTPMALAPVAYALWLNQLRFDPDQPQWPNRDRFVLSCGHASMLLYSMLHLVDVRRVDAQGRTTDDPAITLDDIRRFRQLHSPCAGHPEYEAAPGIETTTGPLGQGVANSVGMAIAAQYLAARYNRPGHDLFSYRVFALASDGDFMEGIGAEAASLAGHLALDNLCWIYDDNRITIDGPTDLTFTEDVDARLAALGWRVLSVTDANDVAALNAALQSFASGSQRQPTLIRVRSVIGYGAPHKQNTSDAHGAPLGEDEVRAAKEFFGWPTDDAHRFWVPSEVREHFANTVRRRGHQAHRAWQETWARYQKNCPAEARELTELWAGRLPAGWDEGLPTFSADAKGMATRVASGKVLNALAERIPWMIGGSADLAVSNNTRIGGRDAPDFQAASRSGRNINFGVREHATAGIANGLALAGVRPYVGTFFVFTDYLRPSMRLAALMRLNVLYVLTHDSIGLGEDGPTHQPIEHLAACRAIPGLVVIRPADANEVAEAYRVAMKLERTPVALILSRQALPVIDRTQFASPAGLERGAYVLTTDDRPSVILIGSGSEVHLCLAAAEKLRAAGRRVRVVSMPSWELFERQDEEYRRNVLPDEIAARVAVEAGVRQGWERYLGPGGQFVGLDDFGASAPYGALYQHFGLTVDAVVAAAEQVVTRSA